MPKKHVFFLSLMLTALAVCAVAQEYPQQVFTVNISDSAPDWRPHRAYNADEAQILTAVFEGLFVYDPYSLDPVPGLAESWKTSADGLVWTFTLRKNARFENGDPITAPVIRDSWLSLLDPEIEAPYASLLDSITGAITYRTVRGTDKNTVGIAATNDTTLTVTLHTPANHLPKILCHHAFSAVHPKDLALVKGQAADPQKTPIASGPFRVVSVDEETMVMEKNPLYWDRDAVKIPGIKFILSQDGDALTARFNWGEIHWLAGSLSMEKVADPAAIRVSPMFSTEYFFFRATSEPWTDSRVRNAYLLTVPYEELRANYLIPARTLVFPISGYPELEGIGETNTEKADTLLAEAGYVDKTTLPTLVIRIPESSAFQTLADILEDGWKKAGLPVRIETKPYDAYYSSLRDNEYSLGITSWIGDFADPLAFLEMFRPSSSLNDSGWDNSEYEKMLSLAASMKNAQERYSTLSQAEEFLLNEGMIIPVAHNPSLNVIDTNGIAGWYVNALDIHPFKFVSFEQRMVSPGVALAR